MCTKSYILKRCALWNNAIVTNNFIFGYETGPMQLIICQQCGCWWPAIRYKAGFSWIQAFPVVYGPGVHGVWVNTLRPRQNGRHFADDTFKRIFLNENFRISIKISLKFVPKGPINNIPVLVQIMAWRRSGDKPLCEPMMASLLIHISVTRPQWVKTIALGTAAWDLSKGYI